MRYLAHAQNGGTDTINHAHKKAVPRACAGWRYRRHTSAFWASGSDPIVASRSHAFSREREGLVYTTPYIELFPWNVWLRNNQSKARDFPWACAESYSPALLDSTAIELYSPLNVVGRASLIDGTSKKTL